MNNIKCQNLVIFFKTRMKQIFSVVKEKLLDITLDSELEFEKYITGICNNTAQRIHVLYRITRYMLLNKRRLLMKMITESQCNYCPLIGDSLQTSEQ